MFKIIVDHIQQYEQLHPFRDANNRTFVNALLNRLFHAKWVSTSNI